MAPDGGGPQDGGGSPGGTREPSGTRESNRAREPNGTRESGGAREPDGTRESNGAPESGGPREARPGGPWGAGPWTGAVPAYFGDAPVAALVPKRDGRMPTVWTVYFATPDVRDMSDRIRKGGGQIVTAPVPVGPYGVAALAADPEGAVFGLWQAGTHTGFGGRREPGAPAPGTFAWVELYARDTAVADAFYPGLFRDALFGPGVTREFGRAPVTDVFPAEMPPHFLVHFAVRDCEAALATVTRLGGRVHTPPFDASYGRVAVVSDNQGASFALLQRRDAP
ncbi:VOC family protein [Streptomyces sp. MMBL 11-3]|uniref:VOC family protein n=1 Tax=Streptomyces sp. MMBL 11-3 TaxID=3382639 RepID=UPI0039B69A29